jgi:hypothetical protein
MRLFIAAVLLLLGFSARPAQACSCGVRTKAFVPHPFPSDAALWITGEDPLVTRLEAADGRQIPLSGGDTIEGSGLCALRLTALFPERPLDADVLLVRPGSSVDNGLIYRRDDAVVMEPTGPSQPLPLELVIEVERASTTPFQIDAGCADPRIDGRFVTCA